MVKVKLHDMTTPETEEQLLRVDTVIVPCGSMECQGPHMPVSQDVIVAEEVSRRVGEATGIAVAPVIPFGTCDPIMGFSGTVSIRNDVLVEFYKDVCRSYHRHGAKKFLLLNTHYYNAWPVNIVIDEIRKEGMYGIQVDWWRLLFKHSGDVSESHFYPFGHASELTTSVVMSIRPDLVDLSKAKKEGPLKSFQIEHYPDVPAVYAFDDYTKITKNGWYGDPRKATKEKGRKLVNLGVKQVVRIANELKAMKV